MLPHHSPSVIMSGSGMMPGVHGAGALIGLLPFQNLRALHASSAGAPNAAYCAAAKRLEEGLMGARIYTQFLTGRRFVDLRRIPAAIAHTVRHRICGTVGRKTRIPHVVNIDYLMEIMRHRVPLAVERFRDLPYDFFVHVLRRDTGAVEAVRMNDCPDPFDVIHSAISATPYYLVGSDRRYIDAATVETLRYRFLRAMHPEEKIVFIANSNPLTEGLEARIQEWSLHFAHGILSLLQGTGSPATFLRNLKEQREDAAAIAKDPKALLVYPSNTKAPSYVTEERTLHALYREGLAQRDRILHFLAA